MVLAEVAGMTKLENSLQIIADHIRDNFPEQKTASIQLKNISIDLELSFKNLAYRITETNVPEWKVVEA